MANATLRRVVTEIASQDEAIMKSLEKKSGILRSALADEASHGHFHKYKVVDALPSFSWYSAGGSLTDSTVNDNVLQLDLKNVGALQSEPKEVAETYPGGVGPFFAKQAPAFLESFGQAASDGLIYGFDATFGNVSGIKGMHQYVNDAVRTDGLNSNVNYINETGTSGSTTSIFAVSWDSASCKVVFDGQATRNQGRFLEVLQMNDGQPLAEVTSTTTGAKKMIYQVLYTARLGLQSASFYDIAAYRRIQDASSDKPTAANMDLLLDLVHADPMSTVLYMNRTSKRLLAELKDSKLSTYVIDKDYSTAVDLWNGIPIMIDDNILDTETTGLE